MPGPLIAAIHDPRRALPAGAARARLEKFGAPVWQTGALTVAGSGAAMLDDHLLPGLRQRRGAFVEIAGGGDRALVARDHLGACPLFYASVGPTLYVASEIAPLLALLPRRPEPDREEVARRLARGIGEQGRTPFVGVREVPAAHALLADEHGYRLERYWRPDPRPGLSDADTASAAAALRAGVEAAVDRHARGLESVGVLASGGLDSSAVLACATARARGAGRATPAAWLGVPELPALDESAFLDELAGHCETDAIHIPVPSGPIVPRMLEFLGRWAVPLEHPGGLFFLPVQEAAAASGVTALLDGEGGDELFGCEPLLIGDRLRAGDVRGAACLVRALPGVHSLNARALSVIARRWVAPALLSPQIMETVRRMRSRPAPEWLQGAARDAAREPELDRWHREGEPRWRAHLGWVLTDFRDALGVHDHLRRVSLMAGVQDIHPFLDVDLIELVLGLPPQLAFDAELDRRLLRDAMRGPLPESVRLRRGKVYFGALQRDALLGPDHDAVDRVLTGAPLELAELVDRDALIALWRGGPDRCPRGAVAWATETWRAFAFEVWLRREAGREDG